MTQQEFETRTGIARHMSTEELKGRIQKRKEYREKMKKNPPQTLPPKRKKRVSSRMELTLKKLDMVFDKFFKKLDAIIPKIVNFTSKLLLAAILWIVLGHFVPEIRETLPAYYELVDGILWCFNGVLEWSLNGLRSMFGIG